jgi:hypothetical protein
MSKDALIGILTEYRDFCLKIFMYGVLALAGQKNEI